MKCTLNMAGLALAGILAGISALAVAQTQWNELPLAENTWQGSEQSFQEGVYEIPVPANSWLEYKLGMEEGEVIVYEWTAGGGEEGLLSTEFHGHTEPVDGKGDLMFYKVHNEHSERGMLRAPFSGIHGWYLNNESDKDVVVTLKVAGFYSEIDNQL